MSFHDGFRVAHTRLIPQIAPMALLITPWPEPAVYRIRYYVLESLPGIRALTPVLLAKGPRARPMQYGRLSRTRPSWTASSGTAPGLLRPTCAGVEHGGGRAGMTKLGPLAGQPHGLGSGCLGSGLRVGTDEASSGLLPEVIPAQRTCTEKQGDGQTSVSEIARQRHSTLGRRNHSYPPYVIS
jgi:hypothetical protein